MERLKRIFKVQFDEEYISVMKRSDGISAIIYFIYYMVLIFLFGLLIFKTDIFSNLKFLTNKNMYQFIFYIPLTIISILPIALVICFKKQSFRSLGIKGNNILKSIFIGILFSLPLVIPTIIIGINQGYRIASIENMIWKFLYFLLCIGFVEEIVFRGFIQTRIRGIIKNKWLSIVIVGLMFGFLHIPFQMLRANIPLIQFVKQDITHLITTMIIHIYLVYIYTIDNNIIAPTITHAFFNFIPYIFLLS